jgi:prepilin-type N-terminal cleavage/methylation domain-containing protein
MKSTFATRRPGQSPGAFTLVELLTVIAIIAILTAMLLAVLAKGKLNAQKNMARIQVADIANAIRAYDSAYGRFPISVAVQTAAGNSDFTYGGAVFTTAIAAGTLPAADSSYSVNNSEVIPHLTSGVIQPGAENSPKDGPLSFCETFAVRFYFLHFFSPNSILLK